MEFFSVTVSWEGENQEDITLMNYKSQSKDFVRGFVWMIENYPDRISPTITDNTDFWIGICCAKNEHKLWKKFARVILSSSKDFSMDSKY